MNNNGLVLCQVRQIRQRGHRGNLATVPKVMMNAVFMAEVANFCQRPDSDEVLVRFTDKLGAQPSGWVVIGRSKLTLINDRSSLVFNLPVFVRHLLNIDIGDKIGFYRSADMAETDAIIKLIRESS